MMDHKDFMKKFTKNCEDDLKKLLTLQVKLKIPKLLTEKQFLFFNKVFISKLNLSTVVKKQLDKNERFYFDIFLKENKKNNELSSINFFKFSMQLSFLNWTFNENKEFILNDNDNQDLNYKEVFNNECMNEFNEIYNHIAKVDEKS